jgi:hypothetical protein
MLTTFWDMVRPIYCDYLEGQRIINSQYYSNLLKNKLQPALLCKHPGFQTEHTVLLQDSTHPYSAQLTQLIIIEMAWEARPHPAYGPDISPCDFHLSVDMKVALCREHLVDNNKVDTYLQDLL